MIKLASKADCCGCTACVSVCAHKAICMEDDVLGFKYPKVDISKCTNCGLCVKVCQFKATYKRYENFKKPRVWLARLKDTAQLSKSQSGGLFFALALQTIHSQGVVYGAAFDDAWHVCHQRAVCYEDLEKLRLSKYVQSDLQGVFFAVKEDLKQGKTVLFSGTPCQVAGLKSFIPNHLHAKLFCIDIVCHSVPSPKIWADYIAYLENKRGKKLRVVKFRDKRFGWHGATESFLYQDGTTEYRKTSNTLYFKSLSIRDSCTNCPYTNLKRVGDVTLGDFWGLPKDSEYEDNKGVSLLLINSEKGQTMIDAVRDLCILQPGDDYNYIQPQLRAPVAMNPLRRKFLEDYTTHGFIYVARKYSDCGWRYKIDRIISKIKRLLKP